MKMANKIKIIYYKNYNLCNLITVILIYLLMSLCLNKITYCEVLPSSELYNQKLSLLKKSLLQQILEIVKNEDFINDFARCKNNFLLLSRFYISEISTVAFVEKFIDTLPFDQFCIDNLSKEDRRKIYNLFIQYIIDKQKTYQYVYKPFMFFHFDPGAGGGSGSLIFNKKNISIFMIIEAVISIKVNPIDKAKTIMEYLAINTSKPFTLSTAKLQDHPLYGYAVAILQ